MADSAMTDGDLEELTMGPVILLEEFWASINPIAAIARSIPEDARHDFYMSLFPYLLGHCKTVGLPQPYQTALFLLRLVQENVAALASVSTH
jgi:hypothetical protein